MTKRRTKDEIGRLRDDLYVLVQENQPVTARQVFYLAVSAGLIPKMETAYKGTVCRLLALMRRDRTLPWDWIVDYTRTMRKPDSFDNLEDALAETARLYRRDIWQDIGARVEIWVEKDALMGAVMSETWTYDVPLMPCRGYPSLSFLYSAADEIETAEKPTHIFYLGDHDPSGVDIPRHVDSTIREFAPAAELTFTRLAVLPEQIAAMSLPTRPTKRSDSRADGFVGDSVDAEAIRPDVLRRMVREAIESHIPPGLLDSHKTIEENERRILRMRAGAFDD